MKTPSHSALLVIAGVAALSLVGIATKVEAQHDVIGFRPIEDAPLAPQLKVGHWAPLRVVADRSEGAGPRDMVVTTEDSEDNQVRTRFPLPLQHPSGSVPVKLGRLSGGIRELVTAPGEDVGDDSPVKTPAIAGVGSYLYLCLGGTLDDLPTALVAKERRAEEEGTLREYVPTRFAVYAAGLPGRSIEYETADLAILLTGDSDFVDAARAVRARCGNRCSSGSRRAGGSSCR